jgi:hypothetical protein
MHLRAKIYMHKITSDINSDINIDTLLHTKKVNEKTCVEKDEIITGVGEPPPCRKDTLDLEFSNY